MFIGEFSYSMDHKGRVAIPVKFRAHLATGCVITRGLDNCLTVYSKSEWEKLAKKLAALPISQSDARAFARLMLAGAMDLDLDKQGRVVIPPYLKSYANLSGNVIITGLYNRLEIWDKGIWQEYRKKSEEKSSSIAEHLGDLGI